MNSEDFIRNVISNNIIKENLLAYTEILENTSRENISDRYWKDLVELYDSLNENHKEVILSIFRQTKVDTISSIFAVIDGNVHIEDNQKEFKLSYGDKVFNDDLQDTFLSLDEDGEL